ncbi:MAG: ankyrin repeat domain-containing protein [Cocleimonas sp.]
MQNKKIKMPLYTGFLLSVLLMATSSLSAFDLDAALEIYQEEQQGQQQYQYQEAPQQASPPQHSREYYQKRWLEQQQSRTQAQPVSYQPQARPEQNAQVTPEADDLFLAAVSGNNTQIGQLLSQGLNVNVSNSENETALHMAAARGQYSTVIFLIQNGAHTNARTVKNWIPLHHAVRFRHANIANYLMQRGSSPGARTSDGLSAIDMARNVNDYRLLSLLGAR